jgi:hypothetical protein
MFQGGSILSRRKQQVLPTIRMTDQHRILSLLGTLFDEELDGFVLVLQRRVIVIRPNGRIAECPTLEALRFEYLDKKLEKGCSMRYSTDEDKRRVF